MPAAGLTHFVEALGSTPLLSVEQHAQLEALHRRHTDPRKLAKELLRRGWLTAYQINLLAQGRSAELVVGPYVILERIGEGGMGQVFKARQSSLGRIVALKVIRSEFLANPRVIKRFLREIRAASQLAHPNVVHAYDADQVNGAYYIAMEYVAGIDLARLVKQSGPLSVSLACDLIRQAALGLQHAFVRGLVHRDIKPANLLLARTAADGPVPRLASRPVLKITDFGLARWADDEPDRPLSHLTQIGSILGTPEFISPEQARNSSTCDIRSDLYSLGCTFYYLLTGQPPFPTGTLTDKLMQHQLDKPERVSKVRLARLSMGLGTPEPAPCKEQSEVPAIVERVVERLLAKRPEERYSCPAELADVLAGIAAAPARAVVTTPARPQPETLAAIDLTPRRADARPVRPAVQVAKHVIGVASTAAPRPNPSAKPRRLWPWLLAPALVLAPVLVLAFVLILLAFVSSPAHDTSQPAVETADDVQWQRLQRKGQEKAPRSALRNDLLSYRTRFPGSIHIAEVEEWLARLPSPFDAFDRVLLPNVPRVTAKSPPEMVGVLGQDQGFYKHPANVVAVSPDGRWLLGAAEPALRFWATADFTRPPSRFQPHGQHLHDAAFAPDGKRLATAGDDRAVRLWDAATHERFLTLEKHKAAVSRVAFRRDGTLLASAGADGAIYFWDPATGAEAGGVATGPGPVQAMTFSPDGRTIFWGAGAHVRWVRVAESGNGIPPRDLDTAGPVRALTFAPDGKTLLCGGGRGNVLVCGWDGASLVTRSTLAHRVLLNTKLQGLQVNCAAYASDGKLIATAGSDHRVRVWDADSLALKHEWDLHCPIAAVTFAPDSRHLISGNGNSTLTIFRLTPYTADTAK